MQDLSQPPKETLLEQYMAARRDIDSRRQPQRLDVNETRANLDSVLLFCQSLSEQDPEKRKEIVTREYKNLCDRGFAKLVSTAAKCRTPEEYTQFNVLLDTMLGNIERVQRNQMEMTDATNSVSDILDKKFVTPVEKK